MWCYHMLCWKHLQTIKKISRRWTYHSAHYKVQQVAHFAAIGHFDEFAVEDCKIELIGLKTTLRYLGVNPFVGKLCQNFDWKTLNLSVRRMEIWTFGKGKFNSTWGSESGKKNPKDRLRRLVRTLFLNTVPSICHGVLTYFGDIRTVSKIRKLIKSEKILPICNIAFTTPIQNVDNPHPLCISTNQRVESTQHNPLNAEPCYVWAHSIRCLSFIIIMSICPCKSHTYYSKGSYCMF